MELPLGYDTSGQARQIIWKYLFPFREVIPFYQWDKAGVSPFPWPLDVFLAHFFGAGLAEDTFKLLPVAFLLLLAWAIKRLVKWLPQRTVSLLARAMERLPRRVASELRKIDLWTWSRLDRTTTILMIAMASGAAFVMGETAHNSYWNKYVDDANRTIEMLRALPLIGGKLPPDDLVRYLAKAMAPHRLQVFRFRAHSTF